MRQKSYSRYTRIVGLGHAHSGRFVALTLTPHVRRT
jgi:hypothetical protein